MKARNSASRTSKDTFSTMVAPPTDQPTSLSRSTGRWGAVDCSVTGQPAIFCSGGVTESMGSVLTSSGFAVAPDPVSRAVNIGCSSA